MVASSTSQPSAGTIDMSNLGFDTPWMASMEPASVDKRGVGKLPALGWNSWNQFGCDIDEKVFIQAAEKLVSLGLKDLGYEYVVIDDCWSDKEKKRDPDTKRIAVDAVKFPNGIKYVADRIHELGLKIGIYSDAGSLTCGGYQGSLGYEDVDAETFAEWGIDYLKYDNCNVPSNWTDDFEYDPVKHDNDQNNPNNAPEGYDYGSSKTAIRFNRMRDALLRQSRPIEYSLCVWGHARAELWAHDTGHNWRMWGDITAAWAGKGKYHYTWGILPIVNQAARMWKYTGFWGHGDWDMLEVGNGDLTLEENRSHFALWAAFKSPLMIGTALNGIQDGALEILRNKELIDFNQDPVYSESARPFKYESLEVTTENTRHPPGYWIGASVKGMHLFLFNSGDEETTMEVQLSAIPGFHDDGAEYLLHDMWTGEDMESFKHRVSIKVKSHDTAALRFTRLNGEHPDPNWRPVKD